MTMAACQRLPPIDAMTNLSGRAFDLVMFDLDGTLIATASELCDALNDTLHSLGLPGVAESSVGDWIGHGSHELLVQALASVGRTDPDSVRATPALGSATDIFDAAYRARCGTRSRLYPRVREVLQQLREQGSKLAVVTNKNRHFTGLLLEAHQLAPLFHMVVCGDTLATRKPAPDGVLLCLQGFAVPPNRALFVGDSSIDVVTARNAGVAIWALTHGYNMGRPIAASQPDRLIDSFEALLVA